MEKWFYLCRPTNLAFHDLIIGKVAPKSLQLLLVLGVNFCSTPLRPTLNIDKSMECYERDLYIRSVFSGSKYLIPLANLKIYIRLKWKPCAWNISLALKRRLWTFCKALEPKFRFHSICHNHLPHQQDSPLLMWEMIVAYGSETELRFQGLAKFPKASF